MMKIAVYGAFVVLIVGGRLIHSDLISLSGVVGALAWAWLNFLTERG